MGKDSKIVDGVVVEKEQAKTDKEEGTSIVVADKMLPPVLPVIPLFDRPLFPKMMTPIVVLDNDQTKKMLETVNLSSGYVGLVLMKQKEDYSSREDPLKAEILRSMDDIHAVGVIAKVLQTSNPGNGKYIHIMLQTLERFLVKDLIHRDPAVMITVEYVYEKQEKANDEIKAYYASVINSIKELVNLKPLFKEQLNLLMGQASINQPGMLADFVASMTTADNDKIQLVLETFDTKPRLEKVLVMLKKEIEIAKLQSKINRRIEERLSTQQREFFLKQQLQEIKKELGLAKDDRETELEKYQKRMKNLRLPGDEVKDRIREEMEKLKVLDPSSAEFNVTRAYLDWLTILPWGVYTRDNHDLQKAAKILHKDHYGLNDVKDRILETISVAVLKGDLAGSIILLVGAPGVGKTSIGQSIARALDRKFYRFSLGGMRDEAEIKGHRRTYIGALPGKFVQALKSSKSANPVIMLDEIDKIGNSFRGDPASALLEVLDPEQNRDFLDHYLDVRFDLSKVLFVCTANQIESIPGPLLDRMEAIRLSGYILEEKLEIARKYLIPKQLRLHGLNRKQVKLPAKVLREMIDGYSREAGVRGLENSIKKIFRKAAKDIVRNGSDTVKIEANELPNLLGRKIFNEEKIFKNPKPGVATGLAYTTMGGATLIVEASKVPSKGPGFKQTGQLGNVMVESSEIAYTFMRSLVKNSDKTKDFFDGNFIHLHVPAGATPKDGPSAGITMACALYSLAHNEPIAKKVAMTGELTLTGMVMPIGGLKEKTIAAKRSKVMTLIFPEDNRKDFEELDEHIKKGITAHFVGQFDDVLKICFPKQSG